MSDASQNVIAAERLLNPSTKDEYVKSVKQKQEEARMSTTLKKTVTIDEARANKPKLDF